MKINKIFDIGLGYSAFLFAFLLLFSTKLANVALVIFYGVIIFNFFIVKPRLKPINYKILIGSTGLLVFSVVISVFSISDVFLVVNNLGRRITYIATPLFFLLLPYNKIKDIQIYAFKGLIIGGGISSFFLIINIFTEYYYTRPFLSIDSDILNFYHTNFYYTRILDIHPSYYGMYLITALAFLYFRGGLKFKLLNAFCGVLIIVSLIFLNSRVILFLFLQLNIIYLWLFFYRNTKRVLVSIISSFVVLLSLIVLLFIFTKSTYAYTRVVNETFWELKYNVNKEYNSAGKGDSRVARWHAAVNVISEKPFLGYGVSKETLTLVDEYKSLGLHASEKSKYNAHNQFLGFFIEGGVLSFFLLLFFFFFNMFKVFKQKNILGFFFFLSVFVVCLIENYLIRNAAVIFISFFSTCFLFINYNKTHF